MSMVMAGQIWSEHERPEERTLTIWRLKHTACYTKAKKQAQVCHAWHTVNRQGRGERSKSKRAAQKHHWCAQSSCSEVGTLRAAAPKWELEQISFVVGNCGLVVECDFYTKLKKLDVQEGHGDILFSDHVTQVCEAHDRVILSFLQQVQDLRGQPQRDQRRILGTMCARVRWCKEEHTLTERHSWGRRTIVESGW